MWRTWCGWSAFERMTPVTVQLSKGKLLLAFLGACAFVACGIWLGGRTHHYAGFTLVKAWFGAITCTVLFGAGAVVLAIKLFDRRPGLVLNDEGVHRLGLFSFQPVIAWKHITHCTITKIERTSILLIHVDNVEEVLARLSPIARWSQRIAFTRYGTPHSVASSNLKIDIEQLKALIENGVEAHQRTS